MYVEREREMHINNVGWCSLKHDDTVMRIMLHVLVVCVLVVIASCCSVLSRFIQT